MHVNGRTYGDSQRGRRRPGVNTFWQYPRQFHRTTTGSRRSPRVSMPLERYLWIGGILPACVAGYRRGALAIDISRFSRFRLSYSKMISACTYLIYDRDNFRRGEYLIQLLLREVGHADRLDLPCNVSLNNSVWQINLSTYPF